MRTTVTLEDDVAALVERVRAARGASLMELVNDALRVGLVHLESPGEPKRRQVTRSVTLRGCLVPSLDDVSEALALGEGERFG